MIEWIEHGAWIALALLGPAPAPVPPEAEATGPGTALASTADAPAEPVARVASVVVDVIGPVEAADVQAAIEGRLAPQGIVTLVSTAERFDPSLRDGPDDRVLEAWIVVPARGPLRIVMADPAHAHTLVRTIPIDGTPTAVELEEAALILAEAVASVRAGEAWPSASPRHAVHVEPPAVTEPLVPQEAVSAPAPEAAPRSPRARFPHGFYVGIDVGAAAVSDEFGEARFGVPTGGGLGYAFGRSTQLPDLRASIGIAARSTRIIHPDYDSYSQDAFFLESRVGKAWGPVWGYGLAGLGSGWISRRRPDDRATVGAGVLGKVGAGVAVRLNRRFALRFEGEASGNLSKIGMLAFSVGITSYWSREGRNR